MAQSRRRERDLARRRFERRRLAEMQRREQRRHRNNIIGAVIGVVAVIGAVVGISVWALGGNGSKANASSGVKPTTSASPSPSPTPTSSTPPVAVATKRCAPIKPNPPVKGAPKLPGIGKVPAKLVTTDIKVGKGKPVKKGDKLTVKYVGIGCSSGKVFDASYNDGAKNQEFSFTIGQGSVIPGWDKGLIGMKPGGERQLVIPSDLAYGASGSLPKIGPNAPLIFGVTLVKVGA